MAFLKVEKAAIRGISACVPEKIEENIELPFYASKEEAQKVIEAIGIERRHVSSPQITASDLCLKAAESLINELGWETTSIDLLAFCTQCPDYTNHPDSFVIHQKLGLPETTMCLDFYHGCPGWVTSLSAVAQMVSSGYIRRALLLDGDTLSRIQSASNREEKPLFGDAGTATAIEFAPDCPPMYFNSGTLSEGGKALALENGGFRAPYTPETLARELRRLTGTLTEEDKVNEMDSMDVFAFAITKVPKAMKKLCSEFDLDLGNIDQLVLHQANKMIVESIAKRLKMPAEKVVIGMRNYGNTSNASIPLALVTECGERMRAEKVKNLVCGFGTGLSWGAAYFETDNIKCPPIQSI